MVKQSRGIKAVERMSSLRSLLTFAAITALAAVAACGGGSSTPAETQGTRASTSTAAPSGGRTLPVEDASAGLDNLACTLLSQNDVTSALGSAAGLPVPNGVRVIGSANGGTGELSECLFNAIDSSYSVTVDLEHYQTLQDTLDRFAQTDHSDFQQLSGLRDAAFLQPPDVLVGIRSGADIAYVNVSPRPGAEALTLLATATAGHFSNPAAGGGVSKPGPGDPDPCAFQQSVPVPKDHPLTHVTRLAADPPYTWACNYQYEGLAMAFRVEMTTTERLQASGLGTVDEALQQTSLESAPNGIERAPVLIADSAGNSYASLASVPSGTDAVGLVGGVDIGAFTYPDPLKELRRMIVRWRVLQRKDCLDELDFRQKAQRLQEALPGGAGMVGGAGFGDPFLSLSLVLTPPPDDPESDCYQFLNDPELKN
jgi:hypothetical protein